MRTTKYILLWLYSVVSLTRAQAAVEAVLQNGHTAPVTTLSLSADGKYLATGDRLKVLWWDRDGLAIWYKRLEEGVFRIPAGDDPARREISAADLQLLLQGIDPAKVKRDKRYQRPAAK